MSINYNITICKGERECLEVKIYCKLDLQVQAEDVGKRLEAKMKAMRAQNFLSQTIYWKR